MTEKNCENCKFSIKNNDSKTWCNEEPCVDLMNEYPNWQPKEETEKNTDTQARIELTCDNIKKFLLEKNKRYGDSALNPVRIFSKLENDEQIKIRLDDKLSRIKNSDELRKNDIVDITGYLILLLISKDWNNFDDLID